MSFDKLDKVFEGKEEESLEAFIKKKMEKMTPEEREKFTKNREQIRKTRRPEPQI